MGDACMPYLLGVSMPVVLFSTVASFMCGFDIFIR